mgnify:CR=1 FL=1
MAVSLASVAFWAPVTLALVGDDHQAEVIKFRARFKRLKKSERKALDMRLDVPRIGEAQRKEIEKRIADPMTLPTDRVDLQAQLVAKPISDAEFLNELLVDWDWKDRNGTVLHYSLAERADLEEDLDGLELALIKAYFNAKRESLTPEAIAKNSEAQLATTS